jgi:hypothetical protein
VITIDTSVAHLAGAMGLPVWVLTAHAPDWRYHLGREDNPWYPTMRLFRQERDGDWTGAIARVAPPCSAAPPRRRLIYRLLLAKLRAPGCWCSPRWACTCGSSCRTCFQRRHWGHDYALHLPNLLAGIFGSSRTACSRCPGSARRNARACRSRRLNVAYYSLPQWATFAVGPVGAIRLTFVLFAALGAAG